MKKISKTEVNFYNENGYLVIENLFSEKELDFFKARLDLHADKEYSNMLNPDRYEFLILSSIENINNLKTISEKIDYLKECKKTAMVIRSLLKDHRIVGVLEDLYKEEFVGLSTHMIWKKPGTKNAGQAWNPHQDNSYGKNENGKLLTINLFFDDVDVENGALYNFPTSHKDGLLPVDWGSTNIHPNHPGNFCIIPDKYKNLKNNIVAKKGALYIQHGNLVHGSYGNTTSNRTRAMYSATYIVENEKFVSGTQAKRKAIKLK